MARKEEFAELKVGDGIWCTTVRYRSMHEVENQLKQLVVTKIGRKYVTTTEVDSKWGTEWIFDLESGYEKGDGNYRSRLVLSPYQYEQDRLRNKVWETFRRKVEKLYKHEKVDADDVIRAAALLNIDLELNQQ